MQNWKGKLTRIEAIKLLDIATESALWEHVTENEYKEATGAQNANWPKSTNT